MLVEGCEFLVDASAKFHRGLHVWGWFHHPEDRLKQVSIRHDGILASDCGAGLPHGGVEPSFGPDKGFRIDAFLARPVFPDDAVVTFETEGGIFIETTLGKLNRERIGRMRSFSLFRQFRTRVMEHEGARILDIGGRDRSEGLPDDLFGTAEVTVIDILDGPGVDIVGDAHSLSRHFEPDHFDYVHSSSVFEHLIMPWKVVLEMNRVLKPGGIAFVSTHQTIGLHDTPWDYWRFSETCWDGLFNAATGFEIVDRHADFESFIIPALFRPGKEDAEGSVGHEASSVLVRKTGPTSLEWPVDTASLVTTSYPDTPAKRRS